MTNVRRAPYRTGDIVSHLKMGHTVHELEAKRVSHCERSALCTLLGRGLLQGPWHLERQCDLTSQLCARGENRLLSFTAEFPFLGGGEVIIPEPTRQILWQDLGQEISPSHKLQKQRMWDILSPRSIGLQGQANPSTSPPDSVFSVALTSPLALQPLQDPAGP